MSQSSASIQSFHSLFKIIDLQKFVEAALEFDPFPDAKQASAATIQFGCEQVHRLLETARLRLEHVLQEKSGASKAASQGAAEDKSGWDDDDDGWDDFDMDEFATDDKEETAPSAGGDPLIPEESALKLRPLLRRVELQHSRLQIFRQIQTESVASAPRSLAWHHFREMEAPALRRLARQMAAEQCVPVLEALFAQQPEAMMSHWTTILEALPETVTPHAIRRILPTPLGSRVDTLIKVEDCTSWYLQRAKDVLERTGLCHLALELLRHAINVLVADRWPADEATSCIAAELPQVTPAAAAKSSDVCCLYGMFRLCVEYDKYCKVALREFYRLKPSLFERCSRDAQGGLSGEMVAFVAFCELEPRQRAQLVLRHSTAETIAQDAHEWALHVSVTHCLAESGMQSGDSLQVVAEGKAPSVAAIMSAACRACTAPVEEALMEALLGCLGGAGWDLASFRMMAAVVNASRPDMPPADRIIRSPLRLLEFILGTVYSEDQRCHALDIADSVDTMYSCIPNKDAEVSAAVAERWAVLQQQADELEIHLNCVMVLKEYNIGLSLSFADLRQGCSNEPMAVRSLWTLFRVLGAKYRPALFWRHFIDKLFYLHTYAFAAVDKSSVYSMLVRCLVEQEHFEVTATVTEDWAKQCGTSAVASSLVALAQEIVNSSPALRHSSLEKGRRVLKCVPHEGNALASLCQSESDFIKACELLHDLVNLKPKTALSRVADLRHINPMAAFSQVTSAVGKMKENEHINPRAAFSQVTSAVGKMAGNELRQDKDIAVGVGGFRVDGPMQLRLQLFQPLGVVTDLLQYNPHVITRTSDLETFCTLLGLAPSSPHWAEVMAICAATNLVCGNRDEALNVTEKLLANSHPAAWKLSLALSAGGEDGASGPLSFDKGSALLADAAKICPADELPQLLGSFKLGAPLFMKSRPSGGAPATELTTESTEFSSGFEDTMLTLALAAGRDDAVSDPLSFDSVLAVAAKICPADELPQLLGSFKLGAPLLKGSRPAGGAQAKSQTAPPGGAQAKSQTAPPGGAQAKSQTAPRLASDSTEFPIDFEHRIMSENPEVPCVFEESWPSDASPEQPPQASVPTVVAALKALADASTGTYADHERTVFQNILPSLQSTDATRAAAMHVLGHDRMDITEESSARVLLCRRVMDMCEEVMRAQGQNECPESHSEPVSGMLTSTLSSMHQVCPELDLTCQGSTLVEEVLRCAGTGAEAAQSLMHAIAGVGALQEAGLRPSVLALTAAKQVALDPADDDAEGCARLAVLVPWLELQDVLELLAFVMNDAVLPRIRQMEVLGHIRMSQASLDGTGGHTLEQIIQQAEVLALLRSVFDAHFDGQASFPLQLDVGATCEAARDRWTTSLLALPDGEKLFQCVEPILQGLAAEA